MTRPITLTTDPRRIELPEVALVVLIGSTPAVRGEFVARHFQPEEVVFDRRCHDPAGNGPARDSSPSACAATELAYQRVRQRLVDGRLTVVDHDESSTQLRQPFIALAKECDVKRVAIVLTDGSTPSAESLQREGFRVLHFLGPSASREVEVVRVPLLCNRQTEHGPFDIIGDIHGCIDELEALLVQLGYQRKITSSGAAGFGHPDGRRAVFLGDLVDRGPATPRVLELAMAMVASGDALCVPGNHEMKLVRKLRGETVNAGHGLQESMLQLAGSEPSRIAEFVSFIEALPSHLVLDDGRLLVAHAGLKESYQGRSSGRVFAFALYGETTGEHDDFGLPIRLDWAADYRGAATVVYGHTPVPRAEWHNNTICIDTGCVFGGRLTALRYPERQLMSVRASRVHYRPVKPLTPLRAPVPAAIAPAAIAPTAARESMSSDEAARRAAQMVRP